LDGCVGNQVKQDDCRDGCHHCQGGYPGSGVSSARAGVEALGGLHVVMTERHEARRIDDQLAGRAGRQDEPGSFEAILSLEDPLFTQDCPPFTRAVGYVLGRLLGERGRRLALSMAQRTIERMHSRMRRDLLKADRNLVRILAFSGRAE